ncbi:MAG TPA: hypothetical protein VD866_15285 [Urbifossiella sp.]|nr:hypothetical protein [Urbifossiella sp.]
MDAPPSFDEYLAAVRAASAADHPAVAPAEFERMRDYLLRLYDGVRPVGTHRDPSGAVVDCVPFDQYPTVRAARAAGHEVARTAPRPSGFATPDCGPPTAATALPPPPCPPGNVPMARLTLDELARHGTLDRFFAPPAKYSGGVGSGE